MAMDRIAEGETGCSYIKKSYRQGKENQNAELDRKANLSPVATPIA